MEMVKMPSRCNGSLFAIEGVTPKTLRSGKEFAIDAWLPCEQWSNGVIYAHVEGEFGFVSIDPRTVEFVPTRNQ